MAVHLGIEAYLEEARPFFRELTMQLMPKPKARPCTSEKPMAMIIKITRWPRPWPTKTGSQTKIWRGERAQNPASLRRPGDLDIHRGHRLYSFGGPARQGRRPGVRRRR